MKIVLIWASNNPEKFWNKILKDLLKKGYKVYPVNPNNSEIEWIKTYKSISNIPHDFDVVNFVVPPKITLSILKNNKVNLLNKKLRCQPGSSNQDVKDFLLENEFKDFILDACIMLEKID